MATSINVRKSFSPSVRSGRVPAADNVVDFTVAQGQRPVAISVAGADWSDPASWGFALADFARQIGDVYESRMGVSRESTLAKIRTLLEAEWDYPARD